MLKTTINKIPAQHVTSDAASRKVRCCSADLWGFFFFKLYRALLAFVELALLQEKLVSSIPIRKKFL